MICVRIQSCIYIDTLEGRESMEIENVFREREKVFKMFCQRKVDKILLVGISGNSYHKLGKIKVRCVKL